MKLSTGKVAFPIEFDNGEKATIYFNPNDWGMHERIKAFQDTVDEKVKTINLEKYKAQFNDSVEIKNVDDVFEMSVDEISALYDNLKVVKEIEREYNRIIKDELDRVFASEISETVFKYCEPFDSVTIEDENGNAKTELFIIQFLRWLADVMQKYGAKANEAMNKHIAKYKGDAQ